MSYTDFVVGMIVTIPENRQVRRSFAFNQKFRCAARFTFSKRQKHFTGINYNTFYKKPKIC